METIQTPAQSLSNVSLIEFREALTSPAVRISQIISFAMAAGVVVYLGVLAIIGLGQDPSIPDPGARATTDMLTIVNFIFMVSAWSIAKLIGERPYAEANLQDAANREFRHRSGEILASSPAEKCLVIIRTADILRLALLEGSAFLGLTTLTIAIAGRQLNSVPLYWINIAPAVVLLLYVARTFPTRERLEEIFAAKIQKKE